MLAPPPLAVRLIPADLSLLGVRSIVAVFRGDFALEARSIAPLPPPPPPPPLDVRVNPPPPALGVRCRAPPPPLVARTNALSPSPPPPPLDVRVNPPPPALGVRCRSPPPPLEAPINALSPPPPPLWARANPPPAPLLDVRSVLGDRLIMTAGPVNAVSACCSAVIQNGGGIRAWGHVKASLGFRV
jgi:hypothetical protein